MSIARTIPVVVALSLAACGPPADGADHETLSARGADGGVAAIELARMAHARTRRVDEAVSAAAREAAEARAQLNAARASARDAASTELARCTNDLAMLRPKLERQLPKREADTLVLGLRAKEAAARTSLAFLELAMASDLEEAKQTIDAQLADFDRAVAEAARRVQLDRKAPSRVSVL